MQYFSSTILQDDFDSVIQKVTEALKAIGFGVLTTINVKATLKEKINDDFKPYMILGACNPHFASKGLRMEDKLGIILPCNVVVIDQGEGNIEVAAMHLLGIVKAMNNPELTALAAEVSANMEKMIHELRTQSGVSSQQYIR